MFKSKKELRDKISQLEDTLQRVRSSNDSLSKAISTPLKPKPTGATVHFYSERTSSSKIGQAPYEITYGFHPINLPPALDLEKGDDGWWVFGDGAGYVVAMFREEEIKSVEFHRAGGVS